MTSIDIERRGRVAIIRMRRPEHGNRVSQAMAEEMVAALEDARRSPEVGACVLTGHGEVFCLGGDYQGAGRPMPAAIAFARAFIDMAQAMARLGKPLIAAVNGNAHAGGFSLVIACDMAVVAEDATLGLPEVAKGLFPFLALAIVKDALPKKMLFDIVYRARLMDAAEAKGLHVVNEVVARGAVVDRAVAHRRSRERAQPGDPAPRARSLLQHAQHEPGAGAGRIGLRAARRARRGGRVEGVARRNSARARRENDAPGKWQPSEVRVGEQPAAAPMRTAVGRSLRNHMGARHVDPLAVDQQTDDRASMLLDEGIGRPAVMIVAARRAVEVAVLAVVDTVFVDMRQRRQ